MMNPRILLVLLLAGLSGRLAPAQDFDFNGVRGVVRSPWPERLGRGYAPVWVTVENEAERAVDVELRIGTSFRRSSAPEGAASIALRLAPGELRAVELLAPFHRQVGQSTALSTRVGASSVWTAFNTGTFAAHSDDRVLAWVSPQPLPAGTIERIADQLGRDDPATGLSRGSPTHSSWASDPEWVAFELGPDSLPSRAAAWTSVDVVVLDARRAPLTGLALGALESHLHAGGLVVVLGDDSAVRALLGAGAEPEARFRGPAFGVDGELWRVGFGQLVRLPAAAGELERAADRTALIGALNAVHGGGGAEGVLVPGSGASYGGHSLSSRNHLTDLPIGLFVLALIAFTILVGPVNLFVLKRRGRPGLLVVTIPVISAVASLSILGAGLWSQGLGLKGQLESATWLDQRTGRAVTLAAHDLTPALRSPELLPARGTTVHSTAYLGSISREFTVEHGDGLRMTGGWLPVRTPATLLVTSDAPARARLEVTRGPAGLEVTNALGVTVKELALRDSESAVYSLPAGQALAPGATARLEPALGKLLLSGLAERLRPAPLSYFAVVERNPFADMLGLKPELSFESHVVQGILPADAAQAGK